MKRKFINQRGLIKVNSYGPWTSKMAKKPKTFNLCSCEDCKKVKGSKRMKRIAKSKVCKKSLTTTSFDYKAMFSHYVKNKAMSGRANDIYEASVYTIIHIWLEITFHLHILR